MAAPSPQDRLINPDGRRHYRRRYSLVEVRFSFLVMLGLAVIGAWVAYRGRLVDPELLGVLGVLPDQDKQGPRGPIPPLESTSFREGTPTSFNPDNLYEKIDGRADYFKGFGFKMLYFLPLVSMADPGQTIDLEVYDLGKMPNAVGAYSGERPKETTPRVTKSSIGHISDNAFFLARGKYYVRAIGSDASAPVKQELARLYQLLDDKIPADTLPWAYALFVATMGLPVGKVTYYAENAYSFAFANAVYAVATGPEDTEIFVLRAKDPREAAELAGKFKEGFLSYGELTPGRQKDESWVTDRYLHQVSGVVPNGAWLLGVHSAPSVEAAAAGLARLRAGVAAFQAEDKHE